MVLETLIAALIESNPPKPSKKPFSLPTCVVDTVWFEARGESVVGQLAVVQTIYNRVNHPNYGETPCEVVSRPWQFAYQPVINQTLEYSNFRNSLSKHKRTNSEEYRKAKSLVKDSLYFLSKKNLDKMPKWYYTKTITTTIEGHTFLK